MVNALKFRKLLAIILPLVWLGSFSVPEPASAQQWLPGGTGVPLVCAYNASPPTVATGLFVYAQCDTSGKVITSGSSAVSSTISAPVGIGTTDSTAVTTTLSGASISGWTAPAACTQPAGYGSLYFWQCLLTGIYGTNSKIQSASLENNHVVKNAAGILFGFYCSAITGGTAGYCEVVNSTTVPADGAVTPIDMCYFTTVGGCSLSRIPVGVSYATGISAFISSATTPFTKTTGVLTGFISADFQ